MKFQFLLALALASSCAVPALAAAGDCTMDDFKVYRGIGAAMAGKEGAAALEAMAAEKKKMSEKCITCAGEDLAKFMPCLPQDTTCGPGGDVDALVAMGPCDQMPAGTDEEKAAKGKCSADAIAKMTGDCLLCIQVKKEIPKCFDKKEMNSAANKECCGDAGSADLTKAGVSEVCHTGIGLATSLEPATDLSKDCGEEPPKSGKDVTVKCKAAVLSDKGVGACPKKALPEESDAATPKPAIAIAALAVVATMAFAM